MDQAPEMVERILQGEVRAAARLMRELDDGVPAARETLKHLYRHGGRAHIIGLTGSPGTGKSTLTDRLIQYLRQAGKTVGVVAVDPTSPFSGGAILGDRIRMQRHATDEGVFIRSLATRGHFGGLTASARAVITVLDAMGKDYILVETVGVGQDEVEVARLADATVLLLVPGMGDDIQTFKAGVMEIADLYVINKADRPGAERIEQEVTAMLSLTSRPDGWRPPVLRTVATTGQGIGELYQALDQFRAFSERDDAKEYRRKEHWRSRLLEILRQTLFERAAAEPLRDGSFDRQLDDLLAHRRDPYSVVEGIIARFMAHTGGRP